MQLLHLELTKNHKRAVEVMICLPETMKDNGELLFTAHTEEKQLSRQCIITIAESILFLARQGLALRGDDNESDSMW